MGFTSLEYLCFFFVLAAVYFLVPGKGQKYVLFAGNIIFYISFGKKAFLFLVFSTLTVFWGAQFLCRIKSSAGKKLLMILILSCGLLFLAGFKCTAFFSEKLQMAVPVGISFYTLSMIGYLADVYREKYDPEKNYISFFLYVSFFPHIMQGPIARYDHLCPQFEKKHAFDFERIKMGMQLMVWGYIKKMVIADRAAIFVNAVYEAAETSSGTILFAASVLYTVQIYADFSGCMDIALGTSNILGIDLIENFRQPYLSSSVNDFWKRWHISLSSWFRDYLYIPLGGGRCGMVRRWVNVLIVFFTSGLWHGVGFHYVIWGLMHGVYQIIGYVCLPIRTCMLKLIGEEDKDMAVFRVLATFLFVNFAWIFFRMDSVKEAVFIIQKIFMNQTPWIFTDGTLYLYGVSQKSMICLVFFIFIMIFTELLHEKGVKIREWIKQQFIVIRWGIYIGAVLSIVVFGIYGPEYAASDFIYMGF